MSDGQISQIEGGVRSDPKFSTIARLASAIGLSLDAIAAECGYDSAARTGASANPPPSARERAALLRVLDGTKGSARDLIAKIDEAMKTVSAKSAPRKASRRKR